MPFAGPGKNGGGERHGVNIGCNIFVVSAAVLWSAVEGQARTHFLAITHGEEELDTKTYAKIPRKHRV